LLIYDEHFPFLKDGIAALAKVEEAYKHEKETKEAVEEGIRWMLLMKGLMRTGCFRQ
jgi:hypothetical protein